MDTFWMVLPVLLAAGVFMALVRYSYREPPASQEEARQMSSEEYRQIRDWLTKKVDEAAYNQNSGQNNGHSPEFWYGARLAYLQASMELLGNRMKSNRMESG